MAVAHVERLVVDQQADDLAVGDVDQGLAVFGVAISGFCIRQRPRLVERIEVRAGQSVRLALVKVSSKSDVPVGQCENRLRLRQYIEVELGLPHLPRLDGKGFIGDHDAASSSARSVTTTSAPLRRNASDWPTRSTPTTKPNRPARPASTPDSASSKTAAWSGATSSNCAARRNESGAGLPGMFSSRMVTPSTRCCTNRSSPVTSRTSRVLALDETTATARPAAPTASRY